MKKLMGARGRGVLLSLMLMPWGGQVGAAELLKKTTETPELVGQLIVKYKVPLVKPGQGVQMVSANEAARLSVLGGAMLTPLRVMSGDAQVLRLSAKVSVAQAEAMAGKLMEDPAIEYAEPDRIAVPQIVPNDPQFNKQWHFHAPASAVGGANLVEAWNRTRGVAANSVVAVLDTGILPHADLSGRVLPGYDFITDAGRANDGGGRDNSPLDPGDWDAAAGRASSWHGTHVAGTIGAASNNARGVAGANWNVRILPVRVLGVGGGVISDIVDGMRWAAGLWVPGVPRNANPAKIINMSLGGAGACGNSYQNAINAISAVGAAIIVSAGNSSRDAGSQHPANCAGVIVVAANDMYGKRATYSNFGAAVTLSAPGGQMSTAIAASGVLSTLDGGATSPIGDDVYVYYQGTSMAAPHVAGIASLMRSVRPTLPSAEIKRLLSGSARPFPAGSTCTTRVCGAGIVDANIAVAVAQGVALLNPSEAAVDFGAVALGTRVSRTITLRNDGLVPLSITGINFPPGYTVTTACVGITLPPSGSCDATVGFSSLSAGRKAGVIAVVSPSIRPANIAVAAIAYNPALESFPSNGVMPVGWVSSAGSSIPWKISNVVSSEGGYSLQSGAIPPAATLGTNSGIEVTKRAVMAGRVSFSRKVSSTPFYGRLYFSIDGVLKASWTGDVPWAAVSYPVAAGTHTYQWIYAKLLPESSSAVDDAAWIDGVVLP